MENQFIRHEPCFERILFVLTLDRKKMKERILIGEEQQIRFRLNGSQNAEVLCDMTRPLGTFLINFERDTDRDWNLYGLSPLRQALHSNRWKQPELEQAASEFLWGKYLSNDPLKMYVAFRIWNSYLLAREPRDRNAACDRFMDKMSSLTGVFHNEALTGRQENRNIFKLAAFISKAHHQKIPDLTSGFRTTGAQKNVCLPMRPSTR